MNMIKKLTLAALLVPSSLVVAGEPPVIQESISGNFQASLAGFQEGIYKLGLGVSRSVLDASKGLASVGNSYAEYPHRWNLGILGAGLAIYLLPYCYRKRDRVYEAIRTVTQAGFAVIAPRKP